MKLTTGIPLQDLNSVAGAAQQIEATGYSGITTQENRQDPFLPLAVAAVNSQTLELATSIAISFARSPMVFANIGWDLQRASGGRFVLGLGSQVKGHNERRFSVPWSAPAPRMRDMVRAIKAIWHSWQTGERLHYEGEHYQVTLMTPNYVPEPLHGPSPPHYASRCWTRNARRRRPRMRRRTPSPLFDSALSGAGSHAHTHQRYQPWRGPKTVF